MWQALVRDIASIDLPHTAPQELANLQRVSENGVSFWAGAPQTGDWLNEAALERLDHAAN